MNHIYFKNCVIAGKNVDPRVYVRQEPNIERGNPKLVMSRSSLAEFLSNPMKWLANKESKESESLEFGDMVDAAILTPDRFNADYVIAPATYVNKKGETKDWTYKSSDCCDWRDAQIKDGKKVIKADEAEECQVAIKNMETNPLCMEFLKNSEKQVYIVGEYHDASTGLVIPVKCLLDMLPYTGIKSAYLADLKSTKSAAPRDFRKSAFAYGYDMQAWLSLQLYNAATGENRDSWQFLLIENMAPFHVPVHHPAIYEGGDFLECGKARVLQALKMYCVCLKTGVWPSYSLGTAKTINSNVYIMEPEPWMTEAIVSGMAEFMPPAPREEQTQNYDVPIP